MKLTMGCWYWKTLGALCFFTLFQHTVKAEVFNGDTLAPFSRVEQNAEFKDGAEGWKLFLTKNIRGDVPEKNNAPAGTYVAAARFIVKEDGTVTDVALTQDPGYGAGEELVRVIKLSSGKWRPALQGGREVKAFRIQPLTFEVADKQKAIRNEPKIVRNYSFEYFDCFYQPIGWRRQITKPNSYLIKIGTKDVQAGDVAISIASNPSYTGEKGIALFNTGVLGDVLKGKDSIKVSAYIKTREVTDGVASIWMQLNGLNKIIRDINFDKTGLSGNTNWTKVEIALPLSSEVLSATFGCKFTGKGEALFDSFSVMLGGQPLE